MVFTQKVPQILNVYTKIMCKKLAIENSSLFNHLGYRFVNIQVGEKEQKTLYFTLTSNFSSLFLSIFKTLKLPF